MFARATYFSLMILCFGIGLGPVSVSRSEGTGLRLGERQTYKENFNGDRIDLMLGGQIGFDTQSRDWTVDIEDGKLVFSNETNPKSAHYDYIKWVQFDGSKSLSLTKNNSLAVNVESENEGMGGAGVLIATGRRGDYWMFAVDNSGTYYLLRKQNGKLELAYSGRHISLNVNVANRVAYAFRSNRIAFFANDVEIADVPISRKKDGHSGVALAAYGLGRFMFDDVVITGNNRGRF